LNQGWLLLYLFGASPAICKNFFKDRPLIDNIFESFDDHTLYLPYATSLRMSDIGYKSNNQARLEIDYNSLSGYVNSLTAAIETPYADYKKIGLKNNGEYRQLNTNILQIENEFYNTIRPKQISASGEKPTLALQRRGIKYVEIRSLDLDIYQPTGIETNTAHFLEAFLLTCLFQESPQCNKNQQHINNKNLSAVAHEGRRPDLLLDQNDKKITLKAWALNILESMTPICQTLDHGQINTPYQKALNQQINCIQNPDLTPSAKILADMRKTQQPFARFAIEQSRRHEHFYRNQQLNKEESDRFTEMSIQSKKRLAEIETNDHMSFDDFLAQYFQQQ
jgi:glutamate--cysteine ligase